jgi:predicted O-linked N-acetylglucosamine transferase (SPINDLY family)
LHIAYCNLGSVLKEKGQLDDALEAYRQAILINPGYSDAHSNLVFTMHYHPGYDEGAIAEELGRWNRQHAEPLKKYIQPHANDRAAERRLRIGYVSPDLKEHPVGRFMLSLLSHHDKSQVEVFAYARVSASDAMTQRLRGCTDGWRNLTGLTAAQAADVIRQDQIDILVDLALHTARDHLAIFARKPAPVQVTYLGYVGTTGITTMDYRLTDIYLDPPEQLTGHYSEQSIHLPGTYWCYPGFPAAPAVSALPAEQAGHITFGCFSNFCKINDRTLSVWCQLLTQVPRSRMHIHAYEGDHRQRVWRFFQQRGIDSSRITFTGRLPLAQYFAQYQPIDIALDTFPYGGGTTTCDALWMGVPVVSLIGKTAAGRGGWSILSNIGLAELAARSEEEYVRIAVELAGDTARLKELRSTMRQRMEQSPLMDAPRFARDMEAAYRQMWKNRCAR